MNLKKIGKVVTSKFVGTGPSFYNKNNLPGRGITKVEKHCCKPLHRSALTHTQGGGEVTSESKRTETLRDATKGGAVSETSAVRLINLLYSVRR